MPDKYRPVWRSRTPVSIKRASSDFCEPQISSLTSHRLGARSTTAVRVRLTDAILSWLFTRHILTPAGPPVPRIISLGYIRKPPSVMRIQGANLQRNRPHCIMIHRGSLFIPPTCWRLIQRRQANVPSIPPPTAPHAWLAFPSRFFRGKHTSEFISYGT